MVDGQLFRKSVSGVEASRIRAAATGEAVSGLPFGWVPPGVLILLLSLSLILVLALLSYARGG